MPLLQQVLTLESALPVGGYKVYNMWLNVNVLYQRFEAVAIKRKCHLRHADRGHISMEKR